MQTRLAYVGASVLALLAAFLSFTPPTPGDPEGVWVAFVLGAIAFAAAAIRPTLVAGGWTWIIVGGLTVLGLIAGLFATRITICCQFVVRELYGLPFAWADKHATYRSLAGDGPPDTFDADAVWSVDGISMLLDVAFWACLAVVLVALVRPVVGAFRRGR